MQKDGGREEVQTEMVRIQRVRKTDRDKMKKRDRDGWNTKDQREYMRERGERKTVSNHLNSY